MAVNATKIRVFALKALGISGALSLPVKWGPVPEGTAGYIYRNRVIWISDKFKDKVKESAFIFCHEVLHFALYHIERGFGKHPILWGVAIDHVVNSLLEMLVPEFNRQFILNRMRAILLDGVPPGPAELIYRELLKRLNQAIQSGQMSFEFGGLRFVIKPRCGGRGNNNTGGSGGDVGSYDVEIDGGRNVDHTLRDKDNPLPPSSGEELNNHVNKTQGVGAGSSSLRAELLTAYKSGVDWVKIVVGRMVSDIGRKITGVTYLKIPYYGLATNVRLPGLLKRSCTVVLAFDTSGSISYDERCKFATESARILKLADKSYAIVCDYDIQDFIENPTPQEIINRFKGGGGTSFVPVFEEIEKRKIRPDVLIYFTDTLGEFPPEPPAYAVYWVAVTTFDNVDARVPWGTLIRIP